MRHFFVMCLFAAMASVVFGAMAKDNPRDRWIYGLKVFAQFVVIGLVLAWILYFIPW
jgi:hypothetical protein